MSCYKKNIELTILLLLEFLLSTTFLITKNKLNVCPFWQKVIFILCILGYLFTVWQADVKRFFVQAHGEETPSAG